MRFIFQHCLLVVHTFFHQYCSAWIPLTKKAVVLSYELLCPPSWIDKLIQGSSEMFRGWPRHFHEIWPNEVYFFNIGSLAVHTLLQSVLQCLDPIHQKSHLQQIWCQPMNFTVHPHISYIFFFYCYLFIFMVLRTKTIFCYVHSMFAFLLSFFFWLFFFFFLCTLFVCLFLPSLLLSFLVCLFIPSFLSSVFPCLFVYSFLPFFCLSSHEVVWHVTNKISHWLVATFATLNSLFSLHPL